MTHLLKINFIKRECRNFGIEMFKVTIYNILSAHIIKLESNIMSTVNNVYVQCACQKRGYTFWVHRHVKQTNGQKRDKR